MRSHHVTDAWTSGRPNESHDFPPVFGYGLLSLLLGRTVGTLQADRCRRPESLPPACTPPHTRQPLWLLVDVLDWLAQHRDLSTLRRPGRPRKSVSASGAGGAQ